MNLDTMAPSEAGSPNVLEPVSPNKLVEARELTQGRKRFEMEIAPRPVQHQVIPRLGTHLTVPEKKFTRRPKSPTPKAPTALTIPGFDPSRYGKPKVLSHSETTTVAMDIPAGTPSSSNVIHSPAAAFSTRAESDPAAHVSSTFAPSDYTTPVPAILLQTPTSPSSSPAPQDSTVDSNGSEKRTENETISDIEVVKEESGDTEVIKEENPSAEGMVEPEAFAPAVSSSPVPASTPSAQPSPQPQTRGRPNHTSIFGQSSAMDQHGTSLNQYGLPTPSSTASPRAETPTQKLHRLKVNGLNSINRRNRRKDKDQTASPATLAALRLPLAPEKEQKIASRVQHYHELGATPPQATEFQGQAFVNTQEQLTKSAKKSSVKRSTASDTNLEQDTSGHGTLSNRPLNIKHLSKEAPKRSANQTRDYYIPPQVTQATPKRNPRWATNAEIKPEEASENSNAWGSVDPDEVSTESDDSVMALHHGNTRQKRARGVPQTDLVGWDGKMQPPPIDWSDRPRFGNNGPAFKETFTFWTDDLVDRMTSRSPDLSFKTIDYATVSNASNHADGIGMVSRKVAVTISNAAYYGYSDDAIEAIRDSKPLTREEFNDVITIDTTDPSNVPIIDETTETVVQRWLAHNNIAFDSLVKNENVTEPAPQVKKEPKRDVNPDSPSISIYLRPAVSTDMSQLTAIYKWYIENSPRTAEFQAIPESEMRARFTNTTDAKLPFIVAVAKVKRRSGRGSAKRRNRSASEVGNNTSSTHSGTQQDEKVVGWACASDFTVPDYVERISAELEVYVAHDMQQQGVGKCLMDKLMDACDRGHLKHGGYDFDCAPEKSYLYNGGGGRDLHKIYFILRTWSYPRKPPSKQIKGKEAVRDTGLVYEGDDSYEQWLKAWLEEWNFSVEGHLKRAGAKDRR